MIGRSLFFIFFLLVLASTATAQYMIKGKALSDEKIPISKASVIIRETNQRALSDENGNFVFNDVAKGYYSIEVKCIGYKSDVKYLKVSKDVFVDFSLEESSIEVKEITVWGNSNDLPDRSTIKTDVITADQFKQTGYLTITEALTSLPGVTAITTGPGIARPVIRGSSGNRIATIISNIPA